MIDNAAVVPREAGRPDPPGEQVWFTVREAAGYLRVTPATIYRYCDRGILPYTELPAEEGHRSGGRRFKRSDLDALLAGEH